MLGSDYKSSKKNSAILVSGNFSLNSHRRTHLLLSDVIYTQQSVLAKDQIFIESVF